MNTFDERLKQAFKNKYPDSNVIIKDDTMLVDFGKGNVAQLNLSSIRQAASVSSEEAEHVIKTIVETQKEIEKVAKKLEHWETAKDSIYPLPKSKDAIVTTKDGEMLHRTIAGDLVLTFVYDCGDRFAFLSDKNLEEWHKDLFDVEQQAVQNLKKSKTEWELRAKKGRGTIVIKTEDSMPCTSILAIPQKVRELLDANGYKNKKVLLTVPFQDIVLVCEANAQNYVNSAATAMIAQKTMNMARPISQTPILIDENGALSDYKDASIPSGLAMVGQVDKKTGKTSMLGSLDLRRLKPESEDDDYKNYIG